MTVGPIPKWHFMLWLLSAPIANPTTPAKLEAELLYSVGILLYYDVKLSIVEGLYGDIYIEDLSMFFYFGRCNFFFLIS